MRLHITARHLKLTDPIAAYIEKKLQKAERYFDQLIWAQAILEVQKHRHLAELVMHGAHRTLRAKAEAGDLYSAIDGVVDKMDQQLHKYKEKLKLHRQRQDGLRRNERDADAARDTR